MMTTLPSRKSEAWRYADVQALGKVWGQSAPNRRELVVPAGHSARLDDLLAGTGWINDDMAIAVDEGGSLAGVIDAGGSGITTQLYRITLAAGARAQLLVLAHGGDYGRIALDVTLHDGADFQLGGIILAGGTATQEIVTTTRHVGPGATSRQIIRAVAGGTATTSYLGKVAVAREGQKTDASQSFKALLLDRGATANAKPELEIFADDVKCAHGATVGQLDAQALFYMASRGVPAAQARTLLTRAFLSDTLDGLDDGEAAALDARIDALLAGLA